MIHETKACSNCGEVKDITEFYLDKRRGKPRGECKTCANARSKKHYSDNPDYYADFARGWRAANREKANANASAHKAKKRAEIYSAWFEYQDGLCAVCRQPQETWETMHLDHDHRTGAGRGLCCRTCNYLLGMADDDVEILRRAIEYLEAHEVDLSLPKKFTKWKWWSHRPPA